MSELERFREAAFEWAVDRSPTAERQARSSAAYVSIVVLVEGVSDAAAIDTAAVVCGRNLEAERVCVVPMRGVTNFGRFVTTIGPAGLGMPIAGLCDAGEERYFLRALESAGVLAIATRSAMGSAGFFVCVDDLEDELVRALGTERTLQILAKAGDLPRFRTFQSQPAKRDIPIAAQLHRFFGTTSGRKERYARLLVDGLDGAPLPRPLADLLDRLTSPLDD
ncbi:MAG TPA: TOPRIM nucleotidyl transferase/hydrolase domain-containing protein [Galbitalea sp.]|jgi:hypothetical protein|nr:TOPRIM nucleotidyl transferase/hydrolase domain-containing protein [Galbitalea sp.]